ncbi:hypothetical protein A9Q68_10265 [Streptococcus bovimastitidis]|uniref:Endonuclease/exonuclease/phosphatase domain-containing protein n=1 Tax=Streptococcus bovimastitidis TaxID=1856638 RepID=A0A1L8MJZ9_9STRE|nr:hypothetical protein [Streptococcus bovimastitidis]OJF71097.1 hypothetical protein A9Q68_10265 [Streptococcus bovimastitidis]
MTKQSKLKIYSQNISGAGYRLNEVCNFQEFILEAALKHTPDLIVFSEYAYPTNHDFVVKKFNEQQYQVITSSNKGTEYENGMLIAIKENENLEFIDSFEGLHSKNNKKLESPDNLGVRVKYFDKIIDIIGIRVRVGVNLTNSKRLKLKSEQIQVVSEYINSSTTAKIVVGDTNYKSAFLKNGRLGTASEYINGKNETTDWITVNWGNCDFIVPVGDPYQWRVEKGNPVLMDCDLAIVKNLDATVEPYNWEFEELHESYSRRQRCDYPKIGRFFPDHPAVIMSIE